MSTQVEPKAKASSQPAPSSAPVNANLLQRKCACGGTPGPDGECAECRKKRLQRSPSVRDELGHVPPIVHEVLRSPGKPLDPDARAFMEPRFEHDFRQVRVHTDAKAAESASAVNALAYTVSNHIVFGRGQYNPSSSAGLGVLGHELTHVVQQAATQPKLSAIAIDVAEGSTSEQEAKRTQATIEANGIVAPIRAHVGSNSIQRLPGSPAGGCGLCYGGTEFVGQAVHLRAEKKFKDRYPWLQTEHPVLNLLSPSPGDTNSKLDLADLVGPGQVNIGEIKPANVENLLKGDLQLYGYEDQLTALGFSVGRLNIPPPIEPIEFPTLAPPGCPQTQLLFIDPPVRGVYTYWCIPDYKELIQTCDCRKGRRRRVPEPHRVPVPVPVPVPQTEGKPVRVPVPQGGTQPVPETAPPEETASPETGRPPGEVIPFPGRRPTEPGTSEEAPEEELLPVAAMVALATMAALALRRQAERLPSLAARRALAYAEAAAVVAILLAYPERVEARPGAGESPITALFRAMEEQGTPVPRELQERIEKDPELRQIFEDAAVTGDLTAAQEELNRRMVQTISANLDQFSEEDLRLLLQTTETTSVQASDPTVEQLRLAIERARQSRNGGIDTSMAPQEGGRPAHRPAPVPQGETGGGAGPYPNLSDTTRQQLSSRPAPVKLLFDAMVERSGTGPSVTDEAVQQFLQTVPANLTEDEAGQLIERLRPAQNESLDEILGRLRHAIESIRAGRERQDVVQGDVENLPERDQGRARREGGPEEGGITPNEYIRRVVEAINRFDEKWPSIREGEDRWIPVRPDDSFSGARVGKDVIEVVCLARQPGGLRVGALTRVKIVRLEGTQADMELQNATVFVSERGEIIGQLEQGLVMSGQLR